MGLEKAFYPIIISNASNQMRNQMVEYPKVNLFEY